MTQAFGTSAEQASTTDRPGPSSFIVCAFYTPNYETTAGELRKTIDEFGYNHYMWQAPVVENWEAGTRLKPKFITDCLSRFPDSNILYLDADARIRMPLTFLSEVNGDVGLHFRPAVKSQRQTLHPAAGTVYVTNCVGGRRFASEWLMEAEKADPKDVDGDCLMRAIGKLAGVSFVQLPVEYCYIGEPPSNANSVAIQHLQWSRGKRRLRRTAIDSIQRFLSRFE